MVDKARQPRADRQRGSLCPPSDPAASSLLLPLGPATWVDAGQRLAGSMALPPGKPLGGTPPITTGPFLWGLGHPPARDWQDLKAASKMMSGSPAWVCWDSRARRPCALPASLCLVLGGGSWPGQGLAPDPPPSPLASFVSSHWNWASPGDTLPCSVPFPLPCREGRLGQSTAELGGSPGAPSPLTLSRLPTWWGLLCGLPWREGGLTDWGGWGHWGRGPSSPLPHQPQEPSQLSLGRNLFN